MNCKKFATRALSILLCIVMLVGIIPMSVSAEDTVAPIIFAGNTLGRPDSRAYYQDVSAATATTPRMYHHDASIWDSSKGATSDNPSPTIEFPMKYHVAGETSNANGSVDVMALPILKLVYRTNKMDGEKLAIPTNLEYTDANWSEVKFTNYYDATNSAPATKAGEWGYIIVDFTTSSLATKKLRDIHSTKFLTSKSSEYIDIAYIGFFADVTSALAAETGLVNVKFCQEDGETVVKSYQKWGDVTVDYPETDPVKDGFIFNGWKDAATGTVVANGTAVTKDITLVPNFLDPAKLPKIYTGDDLVDSYNAYGADYPAIVAATDTTPSHYRLPGGNGAATNKMTMRWTDATATGYGDYRYFPSNHPYVKIYYRTNIMDGDNLLVPKFEHTGSGWNPDAAPVAALDSSDPATVAGEWGYAIYKFESTKYTDTVYCRDISLYKTLKSLPSTDYVDVAYIGMFNTEPEAIAAEADFVKVTFYEEDETTEISSKYIWAGNPVLEYPETAPEKDGYVFVNWMDENGKTVRNGSEVTEDLKLYPRFMDESAIVLKGTDLPDGSVLGLYGAGTKPTPASGVEPTRYIYDSGKVAYIYFDALDISNSPLMKIYYRTNIELEGNLVVPPFAEAGYKQNGMINGKGPSIVDEATSYPTEANEWGYITYDLSEFATEYYPDEQTVKDNYDNLYYVAWDYRQVAANGTMEIGWVGFFDEAADAKSATFESEEIKVEFLAEDGSVFHTYNAWETGAFVELPETDPISEDRELVFKGWYTETNGDGEQITSKTVVTGDITAYPFFDIPDDKKNGGTVLNVMLKIIEKKKDGGTGAESAVKPLYLFDGADLATSSGVNKVEGSLKDGYYRWELKVDLEMKDNTVGLFRFLGDTVTVEEAPIMVVGYRTNYKENDDSTFGFDFCFYDEQMSIGRAWGGGTGINAAPKKIADEQWQKAIINLEGREWTGGDGMFSGKTNEERVELANTAPIAGGNFRFASIGTVVPKRTYLDIQYVAFFDDYKKASKYVYAPETEEVAEEVVEETTEAAE